MCKRSYNHLPTFEGFVCLNPAPPVHGLEIVAKPFLFQITLKFWLSYLYVCHPEVSLFKIFFTPPSSFEFSVIKDDDNRDITMELNSYQKISPNLNLTSEIWSAKEEEHPESQRLSSPLKRSAPPACCHYQLFTCATRMSQKSHMIVSYLLRQQRLSNARS